MSGQWKKRAVVFASCATLLGGCANNLSPAPSANADAGRGDGAMSMSNA